MASLDVPTARTYRSTAILVGVLFILATVASLVSSTLSGPAFSGSDYLQNAAGYANSLKLAALADILAALSIVLIPAFLYPVLRRYYEGIALGYLGIRIIEAIFSVLGAVACLLLLSLSQSYVGASAAQQSTYAASGAMIQGLNTWIFTLDPIIFGVGAILFYYVLVQSRLVPIWLSLWGLLAGVCVIAAGFTGLFGSFQSALAVPIAAQEIVLAVWLIFRGFRFDAGTTVRRAAPAPTV